MRTFLPEDKERFRVEVQLDELGLYMWKDREHMNEHLILSDAQARLLHSLLNEHYGEENAND